MEHKMSTTPNKRRKRMKDNRSSIETLKRKLNLTDSTTSTKIVLRVLKYSGNNLTRSKLLISRFIAELNENNQYTPEPSKIVMNLNKQMNNITNNKRRQKNNPYGDVETKPKIPMSIVYLKRKKINNRTNVNR